MRQVLALTLVITIIVVGVIIYIQQRGTDDPKPDDPKPDDPKPDDPKPDDPKPGPSPVCKLGLGWRHDKDGNCVRTPWNLLQTNDLSRVVGLVTDALLVYTSTTIKLNDRTIYSTEPLFLGTGEPGICSDTKGNIYEFDGRTLNGLTKTPVDNKPLHVTGHVPSKPIAVSMTDSNGDTVLYNKSSGKWSKSLSFPKDNFVVTITSSNKRNAVLLGNSKNDEKTLYMSEEDSDSVYRIVSTPAHTNLVYLCIQSGNMLAACDDAVYVSPISFTPDWKPFFNVPASSFNIQGFYDNTDGELIMYDESGVIYCKNNVINQEKFVYSDSNSSIITSAIVHNKVLYVNYHIKNNFIIVRREL